LSGVALVSDRDTVPAAQAIAGVKYDLTPNWGVGLEYRFLNGFNPRFHTANNSAVSTSNAQDHSILLTLTYAFGAPPPPPPPVQPAAAPAPMPAPAPAPAATVPPGQFFIVFFDFDKSTITAAGQQVLDAAAAAFSQNHPVRIELTGFTDTVGTQRYNLGLSQRRAVAVHNYLAAHGVPDSAMDVAWKGKEDLRVPTPDGVREPQNRRVEIVIPQ
jgi:OOP family OmpA-OmpF porin